MLITRFSLCARCALRYLALLWCACALPIAAAHAQAPVRRAAPNTQTIRGLGGRVRLLVPRPADGQYSRLRLLPLSGPLRLPPGLRAVPSTAFQVRASRGTAVSSNTLLTITVPARGYANPALYRYMGRHWLRLPTSLLRRTRRTLTLSARPYRLRSGARYAVLARRRAARPLRIAPIRPVPPPPRPIPTRPRARRPAVPVGMFPPIHTGP